MDALDECIAIQRHTLLNKLCTFYSKEACDRTKQATRIKFLITSRSYQNIEMHFNTLIRDIPTIHLSGEEETTKISQEIDLVAKAELDKIRTGLQLGEETMSSLQSGLCNAKQRTYLWLKLVLDLIYKDAGYVTKPGRRQIFHEIPDSVDAVYTAILDRSTDNKQARRLLAIICVATRPLTVQEMIIALTIERDCEKYKDLDTESEDFSKRYIRNVCGLFVTIVDSRVYLLHQTAREFLVSKTCVVGANPSSPLKSTWKNSVMLKESHLLLANVCLWSLQLSDFGGIGHVQGDIPQCSHEKEQRLAQYEFLAYSATNWTVHFEAAMLHQHHPSVDLALEICDTKSQKFLNWFSIYWDTTSYHYSPSGLETLHVASILGLEAIMHRILVTPLINIDVLDDNRRTPLWWATLFGHERIVAQLLPLSTTSINKEYKHGETLLWRAVFQGHEGIIGRLLAIPKIDINGANENRETPLWRAVYTGNDAIVGKLLAMPGLHVNKRDDAGWTSLMLAVDAREKGIVTQLLAHPRINVNLPNNNGVSPLYCAVEKNYEEIVSQLLAFPGIDVNQKSRNGETPLYSAISLGSESAVSQLLAMPRLDVNKSNTHGRTPLLEAVSKENKGVVAKLLAVPEIDVNRLDNEGRTPLLEAVVKRNEGIVAQLLVVPGIDIDKPHKRYMMTPLGYAKMASGSWDESAGRIIAQLRAAGAHDGTTSSDEDISSDEEINIDDYGMIDPEQAMYKQYSLLQEQPEEVNDEMRSKSLLSQFREGDTGDRITRWLLHKLRSSGLEVGLLERFSDALGSKTDTENWQEEVLNFWFIDSANLPPSAYEFEPTLTTTVKTQKPSIDMGVKVQVRKSVMTV